MGPNLSVEQLRKGMRSMLKTRAFDARMLIAQRQKKMSFYMQCLGEEAIACAHAMALADGDMCFPTYRQQGLLLSRDDVNMVEMICQLYEQRARPAQGRQLPVMYSSKNGRVLLHFRQPGHQVIQAVGWGMASAIKGDTKVASSLDRRRRHRRGRLPHRLTFAHVYRAPVVPQRGQQPVGHFTFQAIAGGEGTTFRARRGQWHCLAARRWQRLPGRVRRLPMGAGARPQQLRPTLIEWVTFRAGAPLHLGRPEQVPPRQRRRALPAGRPDRPPQATPDRPGRLVRRRARSHAEGDGGRSGRRARRKAEQYGTLADGRVPQPAKCSKTCTRTCRSTCAGSARNWGSDHGAQQDTAATGQGRRDDDPGAAQAMDVMLERDDNVVVYGQDVGYFGGVFRCTEGLQAKYGTSRVFDAPISESGIVGTAVGMGAYGCARWWKSSSPTTSTPPATRSCRGGAPALPLGR